MNSSVKTKKKDGKKNYFRYYQIAGITLQVESDLPIKDTTFHPKFKLFEVKKPGKDTITIRHHFTLPDLNEQNLGKEIYRKPPWAIFKKGNSWIYLGISPSPEDKHIHKVAVFNHNHSMARIYNMTERTFLKGNHHALTLFPSDQILLARILADREGCYLHAGGIILKQKGYLFVGHSEAGKSTIIKMLKDKAEILCDDRIIVRKWPEDFRIHGTWSHGEIPDVSANSAPLKAILFLKKSKENRIIPLSSRPETIRKLLACTIKPLVTADWWEKTLSLIETLSKEVPCHSLEFDKSGRIVNLIKNL